MKTLRWIAAHFALLAALAVAAAPAHSATAPTPAQSVNETCLMCHADKDAKSATGRSIAVDADKFKASVHGGFSLKCTDCHSDVSAQKLPHAEKLKPVDCATCHEKAVAEYAGTVHGVARKGGNAVAANCVDCHGTHDILRAKDPASRTNHVNLEATCSRCHGSDAMVVNGKMPGGNVGDKFHDSIHGKALKGAAILSAPECTDCHGTHSIRQKSDEKSNVSRARIPDTCGTCHKAEREAFLKGQHGKLRQDGNMAAPGCTDCHTAHGIQQHESAKFQIDVIKECGTCHADYLKTYRDTFHGQVTALGYARIATCASCHGAHEVLPASNPASKVSPQNRLKTCQQCHAGASANFASFDPHANRHDKARNPFYYYAALFMELLLFGVFVFFGIHTLFWFYRELREKFAGNRSRDGGNGGEKH
jgi:nitrate/TMAO reductase-like tetraheme cytochrome c subunit